MIGIDIGIGISENLAGSMNNQYPLSVFLAYSVIVSIFKWRNWLEIIGNINSFKT